jgi:hypothetical protein
MVGPIPFVLCGCPEKEGPLERSGEKLDEAGEKVDEAAEEATE